MNKFTNTAIAVAIGFAFNIAALAETMSRHDYSSSKDSISAQFKTDKNACQALSGNAKDICIAEAKGKEKVAKADLEARYKDTIEARYEARVAKAEAEYSIAKQKCDDQAGNVKDVCIKAAQAAETSAKADAKSQMKISGANKKAGEESAEISKDVSDKSANARRDAASEKREAEYALAKEKCDALAGDAKDGCLNEAQVQYSKK